MEQFTESFNNLIAKLQGWLDGIIVSLPNIILAIVVMVMAYFASRYVKKYVQKLLIKTTRNAAISNVLSNIATVVFLGIMFFIVLGILNLDKALTSLLAGAGVVGLAVGLALQDPMVNVFSGIVISAREFFNVGDLVETTDYFGKIERINLRSTIIATPDGQKVVIPNRTVVENPLKNYSISGARRVEVSCGVSYGDDLEKVKSLVIDTLSSLPDIDNSKDVQFFYTGFGGSSIDFIARFWLNVTGQPDFLAARSNAIMAIKKTFDDNEITIPFPIRTLDFGITGGLGIHEIYKPEMFTGPAQNGTEKHAETDQ